MRRILDTTWRIALGLLVMAVMVTMTVYATSLGWGP